MLHRARQLVALQKMQADLAGWFCSQTSAGAADPSSNSNFGCPAQSPDALLRRLVKVLGHMHGMDGACPHRRARMRLYEHTACIGAVQDSGGGSDACRRVQRGVDPPKGNDVKREAAHQDRNTRISRYAARQRSAQRASRVLARGEGPLIACGALVFFFFASRSMYFGPIF